MDYYETSNSLIIYLNALLINDQWRIRFSLPRNVIVYDLYKILLDVLSEHVNVRYGNLLDMSQRAVTQILEEDYTKPFDDPKALHYIYIVYFLYTQSLNEIGSPWKLQDKICDIIREGKYDKER